MNKICVNFTKTYSNFMFAFQKIVEVFDNLMKFRQALKTIITNFHKFVQFIKIEAEGSF